MIVLISPAKTLDFTTPPPIKTVTTPRFINESAELIKHLKTLTAPQISRLMGISDKLGELNHHRFQSWRKKPTAVQLKQALLAFKGDVYLGLQADSFKQADFNFAQQHLRILSGLYGLLRPLDAIQAYRLEMGTKFAINKTKNLYGYWGDKLSEQLNSDVDESKAKVVINLASTEYAKAINTKIIQLPIITPVFKDSKNGQLKIISFFAKKARGMMSAFVIKNRLRNPRDILAFTEDGYRFESSLSTDLAPVFIR